MRNVKLLSIVIPCHNEEECLCTTYSRLTTILKGLVSLGKCDNYELLFVDNGSTDNSMQILEGFFEDDPHVKIVSLRCNFGYQGSISAGLQYAEGDAIVTIDADLQDPPEKIEEMLGFYQNGFDLVLGVRSDRASDSFFKKIFSENYYRMMKLLGVKIVHNHGDFRLMSNTLVSEFNKLPERNRLIRAMILKLESRYAIVKYKRKQREAGKSKFNITSLFSLCFDGIASFSYVPLRLASIAGILFSFMAMVAIIWVLYIKFFAGKSIPGWASILLPVLFMGGLQLFFLGLMGEYIGRLYIEVKKRPLYIVRKKLSHK